MALVRWEPFREMESLQREMNRLFDSLAPMPQEETMMKMPFVPLAEMDETEDAIHLKLEIPGMEAKDLEVQASKEAVTISGERKWEKKTEGNGKTRTEFRYGRFSRTIPLPSSIDNSKVKAEYKNGILALELSKAEEEKSKITKVNINS